jgi:phosphohistidine phosphatase
MPKTLILMRHAKSSWKDAGLADPDRPLNARGKADAPRMGAWLRTAGWLPDRILSSTAKRARSTAKRVARACGHAGDIVHEEGLYMAGPEQMMRLLRDTPDHVSVLLVVGHNPGMETLASRLAARPLAMPTAAMAILQLGTEHWADLCAEHCVLRDYVEPKHLEA